MTAARITTSAAIALGLAAAALATAQGIPPIGQLSGTTGSGSGQVALAWHTPLFNVPDRRSGVQPTYEFRCNAVPVNTSTWDLSTPFDPTWPPVAVDAGMTIDLSVDAQPVVQNGAMQLDNIMMRAWLTAWVHAGNLMPWGYPISNETINFYVYDENGNLVIAGNALTDNTGQATYYTGDLGCTHSCNDANWPLYEFKGYWAGHSIAVGSGMVLTTGDKSDSEFMMVCNGSAVIPPAGSWSHYGGSYSYNMGGVGYNLYVPTNALAYDTYVSVSTPSYVPPPVGMNPGVPGAMNAFRVEKADGPSLMRPVTVTVTYPSSLLSQYGGLGESSLNGYRFNDTTGQWVRLDLHPLVIDRAGHRFRFTTDQLGLLAIAAEVDGDHDGLGNVEEEETWGTNSTLADSDGDGISDGEEAWFTRSDPLDPEKTTNVDQHGVGGGLSPGHGYYVAGRIICGSVQSDVSNCVYVVAGGSPLGDMNCDGLVNGQDIDGFVYVLFGTAPYTQYYEWTGGGCNHMNADMNGDGAVNGQDIDGFVAVLFGG